MSDISYLMWVKVLSLVAAVGGFAWWQLHDLKRLAKEREARKASEGSQKDPSSTPSTLS